MRLSARPLANYSGVNSFDYATEWHARRGEPNRLYFQLVDLERASLRYLPEAATFSVEVTFPSIDDAQEIVVAATQSSALDRSIWHADLGAGQAPGSGSVLFRVTLDGVDRRFYVPASLLSEGTDGEGSC